MTRAARDSGTLLFRCALLAVTAALGCGGVSRSYMIDERPESGDIIEAINQAASARGFETRVQEGRLVKFYLDREAGTVLYFQAKRRGLVLVVRTAGGEDVPVETQEREFTRGEEMGRTILREAQVIFTATQARQQQELAAQQQREEQEAARRAERAASEPPPDNSMLQGFMQRHERARQQPASTRRSPAPSGASCCVNGAFYECPGAAAVDQCIGRFTRCISGCGLECIEQCMSTDPPDPSACTRDASRDGDC